MKYFLRILLLLSFHQIVQAKEITRNCTKSDLIGIWEVTHIKVFNKEITEKSFFDLANKYQIRIYKKDNSLWTASSNNDLSKVVESLSKLPQGDYYTIKDSTIFTHRKSKEGKLVDKYRCDYFSKDFKKANINKGSISLMWYGQNDNNLIIANVYHKKP